MDKHQHQIPDRTTDDELVARFFAAHTVDIADNGFTDRVTSLLPSREAPRRLAALWLWLAALFCAAGGMGYCLWKWWPQIVDHTIMILYRLPALLKEGCLILLHRLQPAVEHLLASDASDISLHNVVMVVVTTVIVLTLVLHDSSGDYHTTK